MLKLAKTTWAIFLLTFPFSLQFVMYEEASYRFGNFSPWVTGILHAPEFLLWMTFTLWAIADFSSAKTLLKGMSARAWVLIGAFLINALLVTFWKGDLFLYGFFLVRALEAFMLYLLVRAELLPLQKVVRFLLFGALFQLFLAVSQFFLNHSVGLHLLGEPHIAPTTDNVAKVNLESGLKRIRPYGTFLHPNILAAYFMSIFFIALPFFKKPSALFWGILLLGGVLFTGSRAALIVTGIALLTILFMSMMSHAKSRLFLLKTILLIFALAHVWIFFRASAMVVQDPSWQARLEQVTISREMIQSYPSGIGASSFTLEMENVAERKLAPWEFQPVHNVYFLVMNELGIQGLLMLILAIYWVIMAWSKKLDTLSIIPFFALLLIAAFDHFLWDSFAGMMIVALSIFSGRTSDVS